MIRDRLCMGLNDTSTVMQLLKHPDLTLRKAIDIATLEESAQKDQQLLTGKKSEVCAIKSIQNRGQLPSGIIPAGKWVSRRQSSRGHAGGVDFPPTLATSALLLGKHVRNVANEVISPLCATVNLLRKLSITSQTELSEK